MFQSVLVPLDRSPFAERAIPWAAAIARRAAGSVDLVEVHRLYALDDPHSDWCPYDPESDLKRKLEEQNYLAATAAKTSIAEQVETTSAVLNGSSVLAAMIADAILDRAKAKGADLIVATTHAKDALGRLGFGSVGDELLRRSSSPVLLVRPCEENAGCEAAVDEVLILLDGTELSESILRPATQFARQMDARVKLLRVVKGVLDDTPERTAAEAYLEKVAAGLRDAGLAVQTETEVSLNPLDVILREASKNAARVVAMATHGRGGFTRLLLGSVAEKVVRRCVSPILLCRAG